MGLLSTTPSPPSMEDSTSWNPSSSTSPSAPSPKPDTTLPEVPSPLRRLRMRRREPSSSTSTTKFIYFQKHRFYQFDINYLVVRFYPVCRKVFLLKFPCNILISEIKKSLFQKKKKKKKKK